MDPNTHSNYEEIKVDHIHLDLMVDFSNSILKGNIILTCEILQNNINKLLLDVRHLKLEKVTLIEPNETSLEFKLNEKDSLGSQLEINLFDFKQFTKFKVKIDYETTKSSEALQFLSPEQTVGKKYPYLFSQSQAIHSRSFFPCMDTPSNKQTYSASIKCMKPLVSIMSALQDGIIDEEFHQIFKFKQPIPIPSYLIAIAIGKIEKRKIGPRSSLWSEKEMLDQGEYEFSQTEEFIKSAESFLPKYQWETYDLLLLPTSFPYGGMENTNLTFITPTLIAGDRSLADVVAHEISHSWAGNLVTNSTWEHFWLNEGFTVYIERRILSRMISPKYSEFHALIGLKNLEHDIEHMKQVNDDYTKLIPNLKGIDPDDAFSKVPYEKGFNFLYYLTNLVGGFEKFEKFLFDYFSKFQFKTVTSEQFKEYFLSYFKNVKQIENIDWNGWFYSNGMPLVKNEFDTSLSEESMKLAKEWLKEGSKNAKKEDLKDWTTLQILYFLEILFEESKLSDEILKDLNLIYSLSKRNCEIRFKYQMICLKSNYEPIYPLVVEFLKEQGRMKYIRPLYRSLVKCNKQLANETFLEMKSKYHGIASKLIVNDLK